MRSMKKNVPIFTRLMHVYGLTVHNLAVHIITNRSIY